MIEAKDLRIGNLVLAKGNVETVDDIFDNCGINLHGDSWDYDLKDLEPIPLTAEILEKAGFEKTETPFWEIDMKKNIGQISINPENGIVWLKHHRTGNVMNPMSGNKYYLHQLQNLYYALTGEELNIQL